jgi:hypothetical protein
MNRGTLAKESHWTLASSGSAMTMEPAGDTSRQRWALQQIDVATSNLAVYYSIDYDWALITAISRC